MIDVIAAEAGNDISAMRDVASAIINRANALGVTPQDVVAVKSEFNAYGGKQASRAKRAQAAQALNDVMTSGPTHNGTFYARSYAVKNLPKGLQRIKTAVDDHVYFTDPQNRSIYTARGLMRPKPQTVQSPAPTLSSLFAARPETPVSAGLFAPAKAQAAPSDAGIFAAPQAQASPADAMGSYIERNAPALAARQAAAQQSYDAAQAPAAPAAQPGIFQSGGAQLGPLSGPDTEGMFQHPSASRMMDIARQPQSFPGSLAIGPADQMYSRPQTAGSVGVPSSFPGYQKTVDPTQAPAGSSYVDLGAAQKVKDKELARLAPGPATPMGTAGPAVDVGPTAVAPAVAAPMKPNQPTGIFDPRQTAFDPSLAAPEGVTFQPTSGLPQRVADLMPAPQEQTIAPAEDTASYPPAPDEPDDSLYGPVAKTVVDTLMRGPIGLVRDAFSGSGIFSGPAGQAKADYDAGTGSQAIEAGMYGPRGTFGRSLSSPGAFTVSRGPGQGYDLTNAMGARTTYGPSGDIRANKDTLKAWGNVLGGLFDKPEKKDKDKGPKGLY